MVSKSGYFRGAKAIVEENLNIQKGEQFLVIHDDSTEYLIRPVIELAQQRGAFVMRYSMEMFGKRPDNPGEEQPALAFPTVLKVAFSKADVSLLAVNCKKGELRSFRGPLLHVMSQELKRGLRHAHIPGLNETIMSTGIAVNCKLVEKVTENLFFHCLGTRIAHLSTPAGTDLWVEIRDNKWVRCGCDLSKPGVWGNLPGGELMTYAHTATGVLVVDGFIGDHWDRPAGTAPLTIHLERGRAKEVYCADEKFLYEFIAYLHQDGNSDRLAEFAIGTNMGVIAPIGGLVQVEKMGGTVHVAFGDGYGDETGCPWESAAHVDLVVLKPTLRVFLDTGYEKTLIFNGVFMPGIVP